MFVIMFCSQIFREFLTNVLLPTSTKEPDVPACRKFVTEFAIQVLPPIKNERNGKSQWEISQAARKALCSSGTPITLLSDMFDLLTLESCEELFKTVEQEVIFDSVRLSTTNILTIPKCAGVDMEGDSLLHILHQEQLAEDLQ